MSFPWFYGSIEDIGGQHLWLKNDWGEIHELASANNRRLLIILKKQRKKGWQVEIVFDFVAKVSLDPKLKN